ncbi:MAG: hypothetical protein K2X82_07890, partial [Gemmataceae bacterium]|nr:hypothetical protein [Gemmataceae bacterium]
MDNPTSTSTTPPAPTPSPEVTAPGSPEAAAGPAKPALPPGSPAGDGKPKLPPDAFFRRPQ